MIVGAVLVFSCCPRGFAGKVEARSDNDFVHCDLTDTYSAGDLNSIGHNCIIYTCTSF